MFITFRKFFDTAAPDTGSASAAPSIASLMAKSGVVNSTDTPVATPINITEKKEETAQTAPANIPAESAKIEAPAVTATPESPKPTTETATAQPQKEAAPKVQSWQEVLRSQQPDTILKELGFDAKTVGFLKGKKGIDEKLLNLFSHWETNNGDVTKYLKELSTDYSKMPAEDVMRHQLREEYPKATEKQIDALFKKQVLDAYKIDPNLYTEDEVAEGRLLIEAIADKHRDKLTADQQNFLLPKPSERTAEPDLQAQAQQQEVQEYQKYIQEHSYTKGLFTNNKITIGEGEEAFNFPINPSEITEILFDSNKWAENLFIPNEMPDGSKKYLPDTEKQFLVAAIVKYGKPFLDEYAKHSRALGAKAAIEPLENATPPVGGQPAKAEAATTNPAAAMAKGGRIVSGGR
jgi:hypothetical protein